MSKKVTKILTNITGNKTKTKRLLLNCYKNVVVKDSFDKRIDEDMRLFLKWLRTKGINTSN